MTMNRMMKNQRQRTKQRGTALVAVLWVAILLSILLVGALAVVRVEARSAHARGTSLKAQAAAQSGLDIAAQLIASGEASSIAELSSRPTMTINGYDILYEASAEAKKLDINLASEQSLSALIEFSGLEPEEAQKFAARIADWRDGDDLSRPNGAERNDYATARNGETIGNRPFYAVAELGSVLAFPDDLLTCLTPVLTVFGTSGVPDRALMTKHYNRTPFDNASRPTARLGTAGRAPRAGVRFALTVTAQSERGRREQLTGLFRINGGAQKPYEFISVYKSVEQSEVGVDCLTFQDDQVD